MQSSTEQQNRPTRAKRCTAAQSSRTEQREPSDAEQHRAAEQANESRAMQSSTDTLPPLVILNTSNGFEISRLVLFHFAFRVVFFTRRVDGFFEPGPKGMIIRFE
jgi:hypothetical protein